MIYQTSVNLHTLYSTAYADDANIIVTGNNVHEINQKITIITNDIFEWVDNNGLALNVKNSI